MANEVNVNHVTYVDTLVPVHINGHGWCDFNSYNPSPNIVVPHPIHAQELDLDESSLSQIKQSTKNSRRSLTGDRNYYCNDCGSSFTNSSNLKSHSRIHSGERPYVCDICGASFVQSSNMKAHKRTHTGERPYECKECNQSFSRSSHLTGHMRTHTGERPYICGVCDASFVTSTHLRNHMKKHTGERPFICRVCNASFVLNSILQVHMRIHTGERPYKCGICNSAFRSKGDLRGHYKLHTEDRPFNCLKCKKPFKTSQYLKKHLKYCGAPPTGKRRGRPKKNNINDNFSSENGENSKQVRSKSKRVAIQSKITSYPLSNESIINDAFNKNIQLENNVNSDLGKVNNDPETYENESDLIALNMSNFKTNQDTYLLKSEISSQINDSTVGCHQICLQEEPTVRHTSLSIPINFCS